MVQQKIKGFPMKVQRLESNLDYVTSIKTDLPNVQYMKQYLTHVK